jgi:hypothetical protein
MFRSKQLVTVAAMLLVAGSAMASNFRAADQVYVPAAGHFNASGGTFISDVILQNMSSDPVTVSVIYTPSSFADLGATRQTPQYFNDRISLAPMERRDIRDFMSSAAGLGLDPNSGLLFGTLIFNACRTGSATACRSGQDDDGNHPDYRNIAVSSRIYFTAPGANGTTAQFFTGIPWYNYVSMRASQSPAGHLGRVVIGGITQNGTGPNTFRSNIGLMNASQYSTTTLRLRLFQGSNTTPLSTRDITLGPLNHAQGAVSAIFGPPFGTVPSGEQGVNMYVTVEQVSSTPEAGAPGTCAADGCPGFLAYGALLDNVSSDPVTLEAIYEVALSTDALIAIYGSSAGKPTYRRIVRRAP